MRLVVDASVAVKWVLREPGQAEARRLLDRGDVLSVPDLLFLEAANALARHVRLGEISELEAASAFIALELLPIQVEASVPLLPTALRFALEIGHPVYDCIYLALAMELDTHVVTADRRFVEACSRGGYAPHVRGLE